MSRSAFAVLTAPGRGGIAVIRCVGPAIDAALQGTFRPAARGPVLPALGALAYGHILDADGSVLDEVIVYHASDPPLTVYEVNCHGGPAAVAAVCGALAARGLEQVEPDTLLAIEGAGATERIARRLLRRATTPLAARILLDQLGGALATAVAHAADALAAGRAEEAGNTVDGLLERWHHCGRFLAAPPRVVIAGRPNAGKSTLLNRLVGADRVLTAAAPGTTRDYVEADAALDGLPVVLVDTAGLGDARDPVEQLGVERAHEQTAGAAIVVYLLDAATGATADDEAALERLGNRAIAVWNKADVAPGPLGVPGVLAVSALTGDGIENLGGVVLARLGYRATEPGDAVPLTAEQAECLGCAQQLMASGKPAEALAALAPLAQDSRR